MRKWARGRPEREPLFAAVVLSVPDASWRMEAEAVVGATRQPVLALVVTTAQTLALRGQTELT